MLVDIKRPWDSGHENQLEREAKENTGPISSSVASTLQLHALQLHVWISGIPWHSMAFPEIHGELRQVSRR